MESLAAAPYDAVLQLYRALGVELLDTPSASPDLLVEVGRAGVISCWVAPALDAVAPAARRLARAARFAIVAGVEPRTGRIGIAASSLPVVLGIVQRGSPLDPLVRRLTHALTEPRDTAIETLLACHEAIDVDAAGRRTFRMLRALLDRAVALLPRRVPASDRQEWALLQVTRLLFLRFVESEGWLDGRSRFLRDELDRCMHARRDPGQHLLHPLFFGTLNRPVAERSQLARSFGDVPFLNGGLFEPHVIERRHHLTLPIEFWGEVFESLIDRLDVTLDAEPSGRAVTPEALGRVFEGMMQPDERRAAGAFFTPPLLVDAVVRAAVSVHLAARLNRSAAAVEVALADPDPHLRRSMLHVNVLDPAVGSGAFLVGALAVLHGPGPRSADRVRNLVTRRLHGVDRHTGAVRLCEMRLWLEVLRSMRGSDPNTIRPLPNLDNAIRAGDVIADPLMLQRVPRAALIALRDNQRAIPASHDRSHRALLRRSRQAERDTMVRALLAREAIIDHGILDLLDAASSATLFGARARMPPSSRLALAALRRERTEIRRERRRVDRDAASVDFSMQVAFAPVMARHGGFDLVIGNPPWVRGQNLPPTTRAMLAARYRWWKPVAHGSWAQTPDLCVAFLERAFTSLASNGTMAMLVPSKLVTATYAASARAELTHHATLHRVADLADDPRAGFDATTYPLALIATRTRPAETHSIHLGLSADAPTVQQSDWRDAGSWSVAPPAAQRISRRIAADHPVLSASHRPQLGLKTGLNEAFLDPPPALNRWCADAIRGADVHPFGVRRTRLLLWPAEPDGTPWPELPQPVRTHLLPFRQRLQARADSTGGTWWALFRTRAATAPYRVAWRDISQRLAAVALGPGDPIPLNSCYVIPVSCGGTMHALTAWLNSTWIGALARVRAEPAANGYARFAARAIGSLPLLEAGQQWHHLAELGAARGKGRGDSTHLDRAIDDEVSRALNLTANDRIELAALATHRR
ncbi:MAG: N-6 DNA methylase [Gemmatimonadales bacterium]